MKKATLLATLLIMMLAAFGAQAQSREDISLLNEIATTMSSNMRSLPAQSGGYFKKATCARSGRNLIVAFHFGTKDYTFSTMKKAEKDKLANQCAEAFIGGLCEDRESVALFRALGTKIILELYDYRGVKMSRTIDPFEI